MVKKYIEMFPALNSICNSKGVPGDLGETKVRIISINQMHY